jgi:predicted ATPase
MATLSVGLFVPAGNTYERENITNWLRTNNTDPITNKCMESKKLVPNLTIRSAIAEWRVTHALPTGEESDATTSSDDEQCHAAMEASDGGTLAIGKSELPTERRDAKSKTWRSKKLAEPR